ncbi:defender against cell death 1 [Russula ochroleuca]|jgi:oligosaccharyltransferase complex subunit epsilon|uniref:Dolichyl-diphosphooligosaccharide--protein glycosyltransferase subunit OST2 n=1 Tax=Russula ochroleuca TaxID=152965 RepID=A0A9P5N3L8_9AGAM|nr:defender against cell death 1 [Russula ochroleuca]
MAGPKTPSSAAKHAHATPTTAGASKRANTQTVASSTTSSSPAAASASKAALDTLWGAYLNTTPSRLKTVDAFLVFLVLSGVIQFVYCVLVTSFPFNAFLAGFASTVGQFVLTASLRSQVNAANRTLFKDVSPERAFADFVVGSVVLHFFVFNFLG